MWGWLPYREEEGQDVGVVVYREEEGQDVGVVVDVEPQRPLRRLEGAAPLEHNLRRTRARTHIARARKHKHTRRARTHARTRAHARARAHTHTHTHTHTKALREHSLQRRWASKGAVQGTYLALHARYVHARKVRTCTQGTYMHAYRRTYVGQCACMHASQ